MELARPKVTQDALYINARADVCSSGHDGLGGWNIVLYRGEPCAVVGFYFVHGPDRRWGLSFILRRCNVP